MTMTSTIDTQEAVQNDTYKLSTNKCLDEKMSQLKAFTRLLAYDVMDNEIPLRPLLVAGNLKIPSTTAIFNMGSATTCPSLKLGMCSALKAGTKCYALKSERPYRPNVKPFRDRQEKFWLGVSAEDFATQFLIINSLKPIPFNAIRLNEAGDFHSQECVQKAEKIARILKQFGVIVYCYTSREDLDYNHIEALKISGSGFKKDGIVNIFMIVDKIEDKPVGYGVCPMDCRDCIRCLKGGMKTVVLKH